ncbi:chromatin assembly factor 1 subunit A-domain-containing protein [Astrocystis sublimbata]|nr:chromatin assembly factor 1 subunit A-domain-containing protein [Astrocystis sublimbata]
MPLSSVSPNIQALLAGSRTGKTSRERETIAANTTCGASMETLGYQGSCSLTSSTMGSSEIECQPPALPGVPVIKMDSPPDSSPLTEPGSVTPSLNSPSPDVSPSKTAPTNPATSHAIADPPVTAATKRKHNMTTVEKTKERVEKKQKQDEAAAEKARIAAEKTAEKEKKANEKAIKAAEKAKTDADKEASRAAKAAEKAKAEAEKEAKRQKKQEEELAAKAKREKQQNLMASFLKKAPAAPAKPNDPPPPTINVDTSSPSKLKREAEPFKSAYELHFQPFFVKAGVSMAAPLLQMDADTKEAKAAILDEYMHGERGEHAIRHPFDAAETFNFAFAQKRGIIPPSVKKLMETVYGDDYQNAFGISNARTESQTEKLYTNVQDQLNEVQMKYLRFYEDVRPAYFGTVTLPMPYQKLKKLSRRPTGRTLPLAYDYDSEAEWVEDDGEDIDDAEDEEEDIDGDEELDDFVDDSEAMPTIIRPGFEADSLPMSSGICFENRQRVGPRSTVCKYKLEFLLDTLEHHYMINPFSTEYWPAPAKKAAAAATVSSAPKTITSMLPPATPRDATTNAAAALLDIDNGVPRNILEDFKRALLSDECKDYSKSTVIEVLAKRFTSCTKAQVKVTLDTIAHRVTPNASKKSVKIWALKPKHALRKP